MLKTIDTDIDTDEQAERDLLDTRVPPHVRIINGALDEDPSSPASIVLNGRIDPNTLRFLNVDQSYQRPLGNRGDIYDAMKAGIIVPNIDVGVRGQDFQTDGDDYIIKSKAYIIDGWQRVGTALKLLEHNPNYPLRIFCTAHFGTDDKWERHRFTELNKNVRKVSPNLHLRNMRDTNDAVLTLFGLTNTKTFPLYKRVCWSQAMSRGELITARDMVRVGLRLHAHKTSLSGQGTIGAATGLATAAARVSLPIFRRNIEAYFSVLHECWSLDAIEYRKRAPHIKSTFMVQLARMFSSHVDFWDQTDRIFFVSANWRRKLASFPLGDPYIANLAGAGGAAINILYDQLVNHMNSGKRTGRLKPRNGRTAA